MKKNQADDRQKDIVINIVTIIALVILVFGVTYAVFAYSKGGTEENTIKTGSITFAYTETSDGIELTNATPLSDEQGKNIPASGINGVVRGYFDFNVSATVHGTTAIHYNVYGIDISDGNKLDPKSVKVYLTDGENENALDGYKGAVPTYSSLEDISVNDDIVGNVKGKILYSNTFNQTDRHNYRLRLWVDKDYEMSGISKTFKMKVNVKATA